MRFRAQTNQRFRIWQNAVHYDANYQMTIQPQCIQKTTNHKTFLISVNEIVRHVSFRTSLDQKNFNESGSLHDDPAGSLLNLIRTTL